MSPQRWGVRARKKWYSEQPRGTVKTAQEIRKENEKKAAKMRSSASSNSADASVGSGEKRGKDFNATGDDFAPLGGSEAALSAPNSTWGAKGSDQASNVVEE